MRTGPRIAVCCLLVLLALSATAHAAPTLNVFADNNKIGLGTLTTVGAHAEFDASFAGGMITYKYKPLDQPCAASPAADSGADATGSQGPSPVAAGPGEANVGGQKVQLGIGNWHICGWLVDNSGKVFAAGSTTVKVMPYFGYLTIAVDRKKSVFEFQLVYSISEPSKLYVALQRAAKPCPKKPKGKVQLLPQAGQAVASDGGVGRKVSVNHLAPGNWRACGWLVGQHGRSGPVTREFSVPKRKRTAGHAAGR